jgi:two-component system cell cycle sensor histidine kinase/response regulator CckA
MSVAARMMWTTENSKPELDVLFQNSPFGLAQCQRQGSITAFNPALREMLGNRAGVPRPSCFGDLVHPKDRSEAERLFGELFEQQRESFQINSHLSGANAQPVRFSGWRVAGENGKADFVLAMVEDCSRNYEAEQRLHQAERLEAVGRLAGGVAHDFNNLLTGVLLYCDLLLANLEPCHRVRKYAEEIRKAGMQATDLVRQLLKVARPTSCEPRLFSFNDVAEGMRNLLVRLIGENIELTFNLHPGLGLIRMDPTQAQQILLNLVLNARDAMPGGGRITLETSNCTMQVLEEARLEGSSPASIPCALFVVEDNGSGMDAATHARLFEAFFTTKGSKGTGLGLATVYDIVTSNGGLIHVDSALARGTRVSVLLPLVPEAVLHAQDDSDFHPETNRGVLIPNQ